MIGEVRMFQGQRYECEAIEPYTRKDGAQSSIALWGTHCATCSQPFTAKMAVGQWDRPDFRGPVRRCREHAKRGRSVRHEGTATKNLRILKIDEKTIRNAVRNKSAETAEKFRTAEPDEDL